MCSKIKHNIYFAIQEYCKLLRNAIDRKKLSNTNFSMITNHCMGGFIYHDLGQQFLSPTINLKICPSDFVEILKHLQYYMEQEIVHASEIEEAYPVGKMKKYDGVGFVYIYFVHYHDFEEAVKKWKERASRINYDNLFVMMTARDGCDDSVLHDFENVGYEYKVCYTLKPYDELQHCKYARLDNGKELKGYISDMVNIFGKRAFECNGFDYIAFLNKKSNINYR